MAIIIEEIKTSKKYIFLGSGFDASPSNANISNMKSPADFFIKKILKSEILKSEQTKGIRGICASDDKGEIKWFYSHQVRVYSVEGMSPLDLLNGINFDDRE